MTSRKRNEFLDLPSDEDSDNGNDGAKNHHKRDGRSDSDDRGYDSEAAEERRVRGRGGGPGRRGVGLPVQRPAKRRRIGEDHHDDDDDDDDDDDLGSDSGEEEDSNDDVEVRRGESALTMKTEATRDAGSRTTTTGSALQDPRFDAIFSEEDEEEAKNEAQDGAASNDHGDSNDDEDGDHDDKDDSNHSVRESKKVKPIKPSKKKNKTGVIYLSSLPPYLKPFALKNMLETRGFGPINRIFLTPFVPSSSTSSASRRSANKRKSYTDGWVEFESKKTAKICAETLNASIVGGRKGGWYHDDVWNMKYLRGFKWADLMEQVQRERSEREAKRRIEDARARKEEKVFLAGVEKGKVLDGIKRKKEEKIKRMANTDGGDDDHRGGQGDDGDGGQTFTRNPPSVRRVFKQNEVKIRRDPDRSDAVLADDAKRVLGKIF